MLFQMNFISGILKKTYKGSDIIRTAFFFIIDFYLKEAAAYPIHGVVAEKIKLVDVGKLSTLDSLEHSYDQYK